jgi:hypothetical protein
MEPSPYVRSCPRCDTSFTAVSERGVCPGCKLFFRRNREGTLVGIVATFDTPSQFDWPFEPLDDLCAATFEAFQYGGGPIFVSDRHDQYPSVDLVHQQLVEMFREIKNSIKPHLPDSAKYGHDVDTLPSCVERELTQSFGAEGCWMFRGRDYEQVAPPVCQNCGGSDFEPRGRVGFWDGASGGGFIYGAVCRWCRTEWQCRSDPIACRDRPHSLRWWRQEQARGDADESGCSVKD